MITHFAYCVHTILEDISPKVNVTARLKFEPAYLKATVQHINHYAMGILPVIKQRNQTNQIKLNHICVNLLIHINETILGRKQNNTPKKGNGL